MSESRFEKIRKARLLQPQSELDRKANKAAERNGKLWTQEELDAADKEAAELSAYFRRHRDCMMDIEAFVAGYRQGHDGLPPTVPDAMAEQENEDLESTKPNVHSDPSWAWHLIGWTVGRSVARNETLEMS